MAKEQVVKIRVDVDKEQVIIAEQASLNFKQQIKLLKDELAKLSAQGKEGTKEFSLLAQKLNETKDNAARVQARSAELFSTLSLLPGPIGQFGRELDGALGLLKTFSEFKLSDIKGQFKALGDDISSVFKNITGLNKAIETAGNIPGGGGDTGAKDELTKSSKAAAAAEAAQTAASVQQTAATEEQVVATTKQIASIKTLTAAQQERLTLDNSIESQEKLSVLAMDKSNQVIGNLTAAQQKEYKAATEGLRGVELQTASRKYLTQATIANTTATQGSTAANAAATTTLEAETVATGAATTATRIFTAALRLIPFFAIIAAITALIVYWEDLVDLITGATKVTKAYGEAQTNATKDLTDFNKKLFDVKNSLKAGQDGVISKKKALKEYNDKLGETIGYAGSLNQAEALITANTKTVVEGIKLRAMAQIFYGKSAEAAAKAVSGEGMDPGFWQKTFNYIKAGGNMFGATLNNIETYAENVTESQKLSNAFAAEGDKLTKQAIENDKKLKKGLAEAPKDSTEKKDPLKEAQDKINANEALKQSEDELAEANRKKSEKVIQALKEEQQYKDAENVREKQRLTDLQNVLDLFLKKKLISQKEYDKQKKALDTEANNLEKSYVSDKVEREKKVSTEVEKIKKSNSDNNKKLDELYADEEVKSQKKSLKKQQEEFENEGKKKVKSYKEILDQLLKDEGITLEEYNDKLKKYTKLVNDEVAIQKQEAQDEQNKKDKEDKLKKLDDELKFLDIRKESVRQGTKEYYQILKDISDKSKEREIEALDKSLYSDEEYQKKKTEIEAKYAKQRDDIKKQEQAAMWSGVSQTLDALATIGNAIASGLDDEAKKSKKAFEERKKLQKATALISAASGIIQILTQPSTLPSPFDWIVKAANAVALGVSTAIQIKKIDQTKFEGAQSSAPNYGSKARNYADGGLIGGRRHAQGGTMIEAEAGEAIMTRGAVTQFAPLLSLMNQAGGGTTFSTNMMTTSPDNPKTSNPTTDQNPMIIKTYVVSSELTTEAQKQARLKDLSTI